MKIDVLVKIVKILDLCNKPGLLHNWYPHMARVFITLKNILIFTYFQKIYYLIFPFPSLSLQLCQNILLNFTFFKYLYLKRTLFGHLCNKTPRILKHFPIPWFPKLWLLPPPLLSSACGIPYSASAGIYKRPPRLSLNASSITP